MELEDQVNRFLSYLKYEKGYSGNTIESYKNDFTGFLEFLLAGKIRNAVDIDYKTIHRYISELGENDFKASSIERKTASIKSFFKYLQREGVISKNPAALVSSPKKEKRLPVVLEMDEVIRLIESIPDTDAVAVRDRTMVLLLYASGIRVSELTGLDLRNVDLNGGVINVTGKGNKERVVPIGDTAAKGLVKYMTYRKELEKTDKKALFLSNNGKRIQDRMVRYVLKRYIGKISVQKKVSPHTLRHTFATHLLQNGANIRIIQEMLGHSSLSTTQVYTHLTVDKLQESYEQHHPHARDK